MVDIALVPETHRVRIYFTLTDFNTYEKTLPRLDHRGKRYNLILRHPRQEPDEPLVTRWVEPGTKVHLEPKHT